MKRHNTMAGRTAAAFCLCILPFLWGCENGNLPENPSPRTGEILINARAGSLGESGHTKSGDGPEILELRSADGSVTIPMAVFGSDTEDSRVGPETKGQLINDNVNGDYSPIPLQDNLSTFVMHAYRGTEPVLDPADSVAVWDGSYGVWKMDRSYYWPEETGLSFYAYANMPSEEIAYMRSNVSQRRHRLHYEVPEHTDDQTDIILGVYEGTGNAAGEAELKFYHPLSAVQFKRDPSAADLEGTISITMDGVYYIGEVDQSMDDPALFNWILIEKGQTVTQDNHGLPLEVHGDIDGDPFLIIPQRVTPTARVLLSVVIRINGHDIPLNSIIDNGNWEPGKTYTYVVGYTGGLKVELDETTPSENVRQNAIVRNTDVKLAYVRAMVLGYVTDADGKIKSMWVNDDGTNKGTFTVASGTFGSEAEAWNKRPDGTGGWIKGNDGFYYYRKPLQSENPALGDDPDARTTPLFDEYRITNLGTNNHFNLDIAVQSVEYDADKDYVMATWGDYAASLLE